MRSAIGLALAVSMGLLAVPARGTAEPVAIAAPPREAWVGQWVLDDERSDPPDRMLEAMEVPWHLKLVAAAFDPAFRLTVADRGVEIESETPLGSPRVQQLHGDGAEYDGEDLLERPFRETSRWTPDGRLIVTRTTELPSGTVAVVVSTWSLADEALTNDMKVTIGGAPPFPLKRVFVREQADG
jgi:hypothetical protein